MNLQQDHLTEKVIDEGVKTFIEAFPKMMEGKQNPELKQNVLPSLTGRRGVTPIALIGGCLGSGIDEDRS